jgi:hypothetical protein
VTDSAIIYFDRGRPMGKDDTPVPLRDHEMNAHEARIQRLEEHTSDLRAELSEVSTNLRNLGVQVSDSAARISDKIDLCVKPLSDTLARHIEDGQQAKIKLNDLGQVVASLQSQAQTRAQRWATWRKGLGTLLLGAGAIGVKELAVVIFHAVK